MGHVGSCAAHGADARLWLFPRSAKQKARLAGPLRSLPTEGLAGGVAGWSLVNALDWHGVVGALVAAAIGMVVATGTWVVITVSLRKLGLAR